MDDNIKGALWMICTMAAYAVNDTLMKVMSAELPLFQAIFLRSFGAVLVLALFALPARKAKMRVSRRDIWIIAMRAGFEAASTFFYLAALFNMPIASATAILQALPLTVTLAAALFLSEPLGWRRAVAIAAGLVGVMMILRPGTDNFNAHAIFAVLAVLSVAARDILVRKASFDVPVIYMGLASSLVILVASAIPLPRQGWVPVPPLYWLMLAVSVLTIAAVYVTAVLSMRVGDIGFSAPFRYAGLVFAIILGIVVFGEIPDFLTIAGGAIIVATGLFTMYRESAASRGKMIGRAGR